MTYDKYNETTGKIQHTLRLMSPEAAFDIQSHPNNVDNSAVTYYERENRDPMEPTNFKWKGFDKRPVGSMVDSVKRELANGWPEGCKMINDARREVLNVALNAPTSRRLRASHGHVTGFNPHVPTLMSGVPTAYSQWERKPKTQAVRLICELTASAMYDAHALVWRGAATLVIADLLQEAGYTVEIWATNTVASGNIYGDADLTCTAALVKGAETNSIPDMLASVLVSPRYYRVGMLDSLKAFSPRVPGGHGQCRRLNLASLKGTDLEDMADGIYISECFSKEAAVNKINEVTKLINSKG